MFVEAKRVKILFKSRDITVYKEGRNVVFNYVDPDMEDNESFCEVINARVYKRKIIELMRRGRCRLSEYLEFVFDSLKNRLVIIYSISGCKKVFITVEDFNLSQLFL